MDATAGVGHDAAILASLVGPSGTLHAIDVDAAALEACARRVRDEAGEANAACLRPSAQSHAAPPPGLAPRSATVVAFNLGFLPARARSDEAPPTTDAETTVEALASRLCGNQPVSGAPDNSSLSHFSAMTRPSWLRRAVRNRHRHAIERAPRRSRRKI